MQQITDGRPDVIRDVNPRYLVIINPAAGRGGFALANAVVDLLRHAGKTVQVYLTRGPGDATEWLRALTDCPEVVVAAGGDGTVNEVINGLAGRDVLFGLIPGGTTNVLAAELAYPAGAAEIAATLLAAREKRVHLATVNGRRFSMMTGIGYDAWVVAGVNPVIKKRFGKLAYVMSMLRELRQFGSRRYRVTINDASVYEAASLVITNGRHYAGSFTLSHQADISKPSLQVILVQTKSAARFLGMLLMLPFGLVESLSFIRSVSAREIRVEEISGEIPVAEPVQADGDTVSKMPANVRVETHATRILVPGPRG